MKTKPLVLATIAALSLGASYASAETTTQPESKPAVADSAADQFYAEMQERYRLLEEQMQKIRQTQDPAERLKLLQEHWQTVSGGMRGGYGMGPGMMHGYGMGPGMMRGYGMGPGMMGGYGAWPQLIDLSPEQQATLAKIRDEMRSTFHALMVQVGEQRISLAELIAMPQPDSAAISGIYQKMSELRQQMIEAAAEARKQMAAVLTPEQAETLRLYWQRWTSPAN